MNLKPKVANGVGKKITIDNFNYFDLVGKITVGKNKFYTLETFDFNPIISNDVYDHKNYCYIMDYYEDGKLMRRIHDRPRVSLMTKDLYNKFLESIEKYYGFKPCNKLFEKLNLKENPKFANPKTINVKDFDWSRLPKNFSHIMMHSNGNWWADEPIVNATPQNGGWVTYSDKGMREVGIDNKMNIIITTDKSWDKSKVKRP
jgi:hypothetical protein